MWRTITLIIQLEVTRSKRITLRSFSTHKNPGNSFFHTRKWQLLGQSHFFHFSFLLTQTKQQVAEDLSSNGRNKLALFFSSQYWMCASMMAKYIMQRILNIPKSRNKADSGCKRQSEDSVSFLMDIWRTITHVCTICINKIFQTYVKSSLQWTLYTTNICEIFLLLISVKCSIFLIKSLQFSSMNHSRNIIILNTINLKNPNFIWLAG